MSDPTYEDWLRNELFEQAPLNISVIDRDLRIVAANRNFVSLFGEPEGRKCFDVHMGRDEPCEDCPVERTFLDGQSRVNEGTGIDQQGRASHYQVHVAPIVTEDGSIPYVIEMSTDVSETTRLKNEYQTLFEQVPCYVTVLDRDFRVVRANRRFHDMFGDPGDQKCYEAMKRRGGQCESCPARETFADGRIHTSEQIGVSRSGETTHYIVTTAPAAEENGVDHVIEMAIDVTRLRSVEEKLRRAHALREALVEHGIDAILGTGPRGNVLLFNPAAERLFGRSAAEVLGGPLPEGMLPPEFERIARARAGDCVLQSTTVRSAEGEEIPVRLSGHALERDGEFLGAAAFLQDLRQVKRLEREKIEAERLAAVGQTVAGLAHGVKNILTGLEGGMYFVKSGLKGGREERLEEGWGMLERNMERISVLVKNLLSFSKGRVPRVSVTDPARFVHEMVALYGEAAAKEGVILEADTSRPAAPAPLDAEGVHGCLANLVSNAIDACQMSGRKPCRVRVGVRDEGEDLVFEVEDEGCGMDQKVRELAFTNFFTTKGSGGTGLGLLLAAKITQEHGGRIEFDTTPGQGSVFRLVFPRDRLPEPAGTERG